MSDEFRAPAIRPTPSVYSFNRHNQGNEKMGRRLSQSVDEAGVVVQLAREISMTLTGSAPPEQGRDIAPPSSKGIIANIDHQALQIEKRLEETRAILEHIKQLL